MSVMLTQPVAACTALRSVLKAPGYADNCWTGPAQLLPRLVPPRWYQFSSPSLQCTNGTESIAALPDAGINPTKAQNERTTMQHSNRCSFSLLPSSSPAGTPLLHRLRRPWRPPEGGRCFNQLRRSNGPHATHLLRAVKSTVVLLLCCAFTASPQRDEYRIARQPLLNAKAPGSAKAVGVALTRGAQASYEVVCFGLVSCRRVNKLLPHPPARSPVWMHQPQKDYTAPTNSLRRLTRSGWRFVCSSQHGQRGIGETPLYTATTREAGRLRSGGGGKAITPKQSIMWLCFSICAHLTDPSDASLPHGHFR